MNYVTSNYGNASYFYPNNSGSVGNYTKAVPSQTLITFDYSQVLLTPTIVNVSFLLDVQTNPLLIISHRVLSGAGNKIVSFILSGGMAGINYNLSVVATLSDTSVRTDVLTVQITGDNDMDCCDPAGRPSFIARIPAGYQQGALSQDGIYATGLIRYYVSDQPPLGPNVMDEWYDTTTNTLMEYITNGVMNTWAPMGSTSPGDGSTIGEAPVNGLLYGRQDAGWAVVPTTTGGGGGGGGISEAPTDGQQYGRQSSTWTVVNPSRGALPLSGGTMTGSLILAHDPTTNLEAATKEYVDAHSGTGGGAGYLPLTGGTLTGALVIANNSFIIDHATVDDKLIVGRVGGSNRWQIHLGDAAPETGGSSGSNFSIAAFADNGISFTTPVTINRASGNVTFTSAEEPTSGKININTAVGVTRNIIGQTSGKQRWSLALGDSNPEVGGNQGSNLYIARYDDTGTFIDEPFVIARGDGSIRMNGPVSIFRNNLIISHPTVDDKLIQGQVNGVPRWAIHLGDAAAESGGNAGSNFSIAGYSDGGSFINEPIQISRASGIVTFAQPIVNPSDGRLKSDIEPVKDALAIIDKLQGVFFKGKNLDKRQVGLVAQDVASALPEVVFETNIKDEKDPVLGIAYSNIVAVLINAVKELSARVVELEAKT